MAADQATNKAGTTEEQAFSCRCSCRGEVARASRKGLQRSRPSEGGKLAWWSAREFREAVDYVRRAAWVVQEWQEDQLQEHDPQTVLPLLTAERIRRVTQLNKAMATDLAARELTSETAGLEELFQAVESLHQRVADLLKGP